MSIVLFHAHSPTPRTVSSSASALHAKIRTLDSVGQNRALTVLNGLADHYLDIAGAPSRAELLARTIARLRACGAELTVAYLEREGTHG